MGGGGEKRVCVVTGGNAGIGREVASGLMEDNENHVILACRNMAKCQQAKVSLEQRGLPGSCECALLDVSSYDSVRNFGGGLLHRLRSDGCRLHVLVNNAGILGAPLAQDGMDEHLRTNHMGSFLLTRLLLPVMSPSGRIVNVSSAAHKIGTLRVNDRKIVSTPRHWFMQYARSKLCNVLFTAELNRRFAAHDITTCAYSVSPGPVTTQIFDRIGGPIGWIIRRLQRWLPTPRQGAATVLYAARDPALDKRPVLYLHSCKEAIPSRSARDPALAAALWDASSLEVGLRSDSVT